MQILYTHTQTHSRPTCMHNPHVLVFFEGEWGRISTPACACVRVCSSIPQWCFCYPYQGHTASREWQSLPMKGLPGPGRALCVCVCVKEVERERVREALKWWTDCVPECTRMCVQYVCVRVCTSMPGLDQCSAWLSCHSSLLMRGTRRGGKAWWRHGQVEPTESSTQDDGKPVALINWLWLVSQAPAYHYPSATVFWANHNKSERGNNQEGPLLKKRNRETRVSLSVKTVLRGSPGTAAVGNSAFENKLQFTQSSLSLPPHMY